MSHSVALVLDSSTFSVAAGDRFAAASVRSSFLQLRFGAAHGALGQADASYVACGLRGGPRGRLLGRFRLPRCILRRTRLGRGDRPPGLGAHRAGVGGCGAKAHRRGIGSGAVGGRGEHDLGPDRTRLEERGMGELDGGHVVAHDDHAHAGLGQVEQLLGEPVGHADATMRGGASRQHAGVQGDARPRDALHERHLGIVVEVGVVLAVLLQDREDAGRGLVAGLAGGDRRAQDLAVGVVDRHMLAAERHDRQDRRAGHAGERQGEVLPLGFGAPLRLGRRREADRHQGGTGGQGGNCKSWFSGMRHTGPTGVGCRNGSASSGYCQA